MNIMERLRGEKPIDDNDVVKLRQLRFRHAPNVVWTTSGGETVVFDVDRGKYESLNEVATSVWQLVADWKTFDDVIRTIELEYELSTRADVEQMQRDVAALLIRLGKARTLIAEPLADV